MIDAYTIGITLALEDGVSDGIAAIRRDLAALDSAVAETAARLLMLRKLSTEVGLAMPGGPSSQNTGLFAPALHRPPPAPQLPAPADLRAAESPMAPSPPIASASPASVSSLTMLLPEITQPVAHTSPIEPPPPASPALQPESGASPASPVLLPQAVQHAPAAPIAIPPAAEHPSPAPLVMGTAIWPAPVAPVAAPSTPASESKLQEPKQELPAGPQSISLPPLDFAAIARAVVPKVTASPVPAAPQSEPPVASPPSLEFPEPISVAVPSQTSPSRPPPVVAMSPPIASVRQPLPYQTPGRSPAAAQPHRIAASPNAPAPGRQPAAPIVSAPNVERAPTQEKVTSNTSAAATPADRQQADRLGYADIHLDGAALGRWITTHLERQVIRPPSGATGFDPRMTPSWSGAPIGN